MDPAQWSPPDVHRTDRIDYFPSAVLPSPRFFPLVSAASEWQPGPPTPILQTSHEGFRGETVPSPSARQTGEDFPATPPWRMFHSDPQNQQPVERPMSMSMSMLMNPFPVQTLNPLPAVPSPLNLRSSSPAAMRAQTELTPILWCPYTPQNYCQPNVGFPPTAAYPRPDLGPYMLVPPSIPVQVWYAPYSPAGSLFFGNEYHPSWYQSPQTVPVHQNISPVL